MDLSCLTIYPPIPPVPKLANDSNTFVHSTYNPSSGGLTQMISAALARSTFSGNDIHALVNNLLNKKVDSWTVSEITKTTPIPSIIIYTSIALALFLIFSFIFCVTSCRNSKNYQRGKNRQSKTTKVCVCLLILVYLLGIGDMIYVAYRINQSKSSFDNTIKELNQDIYPREVAEHLEYLNKQLDHLDQYCVHPNSILINASKSMLVKAFDRILTEKYVVLNITHSVNSMDEHIRELNDEVDKQKAVLPSSAIALFHDLEQRYQNLLLYVQTPIKEVCNYANGSQTDIDRKLLEALDTVHVQLKKVSDTINQDVLSEITPWENNMLLDTNLEEQIRRYASLATTLFLVAVILLGGIPLIFFLFILISRLCGCSQDKSGDDSRIPMGDVTKMPGTISADDDSINHSPFRKRNKVTPANHYPLRNRSKGGNPSGVVLCLIRIAFGVMIVLLILMALLTGVYYALDLAVQGTCRTVHNDQSYLINLVTEQLIQANVIFGNSSEMNTTLMNVINDCENQVHFSRKLLESYWSTLDNDVNGMMNTLSGQIYDQFVQSIGDIDIPEDMKLLVEFLSEANVSKIPMIVGEIEKDLTTLEGYFAKINASNSTLPQNLVQNTIDDFKAYLKNVLESTVDGCPLPLSTISKTDLLICHTLGGAIDGLWLSVFFCMTLITVGFCIFGICVYKRLNTSSGSSPSTMRF